MRSRGRETCPWPERTGASSKRHTWMPAGLKEEETAFLYLVSRVLKRAPRGEIEAWRPWLMRQLQEINP